MCAARAALPVAAAAYKTQYGQDTSGEVRIKSSLTLFYPLLYEEIPLPAER
jgi:hypothetical protein